MRKIIKLPSVNNVVAGATATLNCPVGPTYERMVFEYSNLTRAQMKNIELLINGKVVQSFATADQLDKLNDYYGRSDTAGFISLWFARREFDNIQQDRVCALGTQDVQTLSVRMDIDAAAVNPAITAHAVVNTDPEPLGLFTKVKRYPYNFAAAAQVEISDIPRGPRILAAHFFKSDISDMEVEVNGIKVVDTSKSLAEVLQKESGRVPQTASATHVDFVLDGDLFEALVTDGRLVQDLRWRPTLDTAGAVEAVIEYLDGFEGL